MKILVVDDEPPARQRLRGLVGDLNAGEVVAEAANGIEALRAVESDAPDVVLLDIRMPAMDGLEVARHLAALTQPPAVIFTTAYDDHALAAFESQAVDYLLKPIRRERLETALARARQITRAQLAALETNGVSASSARTHVSATLHGELRLLPVSDVRYFRAEHKYVTACAPDVSLLIEDSLSALEQEFSRRFMRVHRNALVAVDYVIAMEKGDSGCHLLKLEGIEDRVEVSRRLAAAVRRALRNRRTRS